MLPSDFRDLYVLQQRGSEISVSISNVNLSEVGRKSLHCVKQPGVLSTSSTTRQIRNQKQVRLKGLLSPVLWLHNLQEYVFWIAVCLNGAPFKTVWRASYGSSACGSTLPIKLMEQDPSLGWPRNLQLLWNAQKFHRNLPRQCWIRIIYSNLIPYFVSSSPPGSHNWCLSLRFPNIGCVCISYRLYACYIFRPYLLSLFTVLQYFILPYVAV
jgi:hypothetical protein